MEKQKLNAYLQQYVEAVENNEEQAIEETLSYLETTGFMREEVLEIGSLLIRVKKLNAMERRIRCLLED